MCIELQGCYDTASFEWAAAMLLLFCVELLRGGEE